MVGIFFAAFGKDVCRRSIVRTGKAVVVTEIGDKIHGNLVDFIAAVGDCREIHAICYFTSIENNYQSLLLIFGRASRYI